MTNRNYIKGRNFEYRVIKYLRGKGYYCIRAYASKGLFDIIAVPPNAGIMTSDGDKFPLLIQAKYNGQVPNKEMDVLLSKQWEWFGIILIAWSDVNNKNKLSFYDLKGEDVII